MKSTKGRSLNFFLLLSVVALTAAAVQQDPDSFFHTGARHFLATNQMAEARQVVTNGLKLYPSDPKLQKLWELLNQQQQQQQQQDQSKQEEKKDEQQKQDQQKQDQQKQDEQKKKEEEQKAADQKKKEEEEKQQQPASKDKPDDEEQNEGSPQAMKLQKKDLEEVIRFLEALKADEKNMPFRPVLRTNKNQRVFKDW